MSFIANFPPRIEQIERSAGFTLIEIMIVVAIVALLTMIAYPNYVDYVVRTNRIDAQDKLVEVMYEMERNQVRRRSYTDDLTDLGYVLQADGGVWSERALYSLTVTPCLDGVGLNNCVLLTATPRPGTYQALQNELALTLNSRGVRTGPWARERTAN